MNLKSLDVTLRTLTPSELKYQNGLQTNPLSNYPLISHNGRQVHHMKFASTLPSNKWNGLLFVKKQSRFLPCPTHIHNWIEINYMYSGYCPQIINDTTYTLKKGQVVLIDTDTPHSTGCLGEDDIMISLVINKNYLNSNFFNRFSKDSILSRFFINTINENANHDNFILFHSEKSRKLTLFFNELLCEVYDPSINSSDMVNSLITLILCELINVYENDVERQNLDVNKNSISPILRFIEGNYCTCTLESTAAFFNMNPNYMTTLLKKRTGHSYKELIQKQRLTHACQMLRNTTSSVTDIAHEIGYENISFFYKKFKEQYGCSPNEYRKRN